EYSISIDDRLVLDDIRVPPLILQPFVENAIWHGIKNKPEPINGELKIEINWLSDHQIEYIIEDNGVGREQAKAIQKESAIDKKSWGVSLTKDRIDYLQNGKGASLQFVDLYDANQRPRGTKVIVHLPTVRKNNN
ncbi:MAG: histidine kinase, partial [Bacteroidota bacterium]